MEGIVILLCTMSGALIGTSVGIFLMYRKIRQPVMEADLAMLRGKLRSAEFSQAEAAAKAADLEKQIAGRDQAIQELSGALKEQEQKTEQASDAARQESERRAEAETAAQQLNAEMSSMAERRAEVETAASERLNLALEESQRQLAFCEAQRDAAEQRMRELSEQLTGTTEEIAWLKDSSRQEIEVRSSLQEKLDAEIERGRELSQRLEELEAERLLFDARLQAERQSAAKGMELLLMAQENLARVFKAAEPENGANGRHAAEALPDAPPVPLDAVSVV